MRKGVDVTSRERVLAAIRHEQPDRVPIDLGGTESSGITGIAWHHLMEHLGIDKGPGMDVVDPFQQVVRINEELRKRFAIDTIALYIEPKAWIAGTLGNGAPCRMPGLWRERLDENGDRLLLGRDGKPAARMPKGGFYFDGIGAALAHCSMPSDIEKHHDAIDSFDLPWFWDEPVKSTAARAAEYHSKTDKAVVFNLCSHFLAAGTSLRGYEQFLIDLMVDKPMAEAIFDALLDAYRKRVDKYAKSLKGLVDVVLFNDDLGSQQGPLVSPAVYRELIKPRQAKLFGYAKKAFGTPILFHSCGAVSDFIPDLAEAGVNALNPVQVSAVGMDSARLKRDFGKIMCFWGGGCDSQRVLGRGSVKDVREEVKRRIGDFAPGGGFVFTQVHNIQADVPPQNIVAMLDAAAEFGGY